MLMNAFLTQPSIPVASLTSLLLRHPLGERVMSVHCLRLARLNSLSHNEYFAETNVLQQNFCVKGLIRTADRDAGLPNPATPS